MMKIMNHNTFGIWHSRGPPKSLWTVVGGARSPRKDQGTPSRSCRPNSVSRQPTQGGNQGESRAKSLGPNWYFACERAGRPANHYYRTCVLWGKTQGGGRQGNTPPQPSFVNNTNICLTCRARNLPHNHDSRKCPLW